MNKENSVHWLRAAHYCNNMSAATDALLHWINKTLSPYLCCVCVCVCKGPQAFATRVCRQMITKFLCCLFNFLQFLSMGPTTKLWMKRLNSPGRSTPPLWIVPGVMQIGRSTVYWWWCNYCSLLMTSSFYLCIKPPPPTRKAAGGLYHVPRRSRRNP
jgi:hypothetical protein